MLLSFAYLISCKCLLPFLGHINLQASIKMKFSGAAAAEGVWVVLIKGERERVLETAAAAIEDDPTKKLRCATIEI
jgi:hypothetical protein